MSESNCIRIHRGTSVPQAPASEGSKAATEEIPTGTRGSVCALDDVVIFAPTPEKRLRLEMVFDILRRAEVEAKKCNFFQRSVTFLHALMKKDKRFVWTNEAQQSFDAKTVPVGE